MPSLSVACQQAVNLSPSAHYDDAKAVKLQRFPSGFCNIPGNGRAAAASGGHFPQQYVSNCHGAEQLHSESAVLCHASQCILTKGR